MDASGFSSGAKWRRNLRRASSPWRRSRRSGSCSCGHRPCSKPAAPHFRPHRDVPLCPNHGHGKDAYRPQRRRRNHAASLSRHGTIYPRTCVARSCSPPSSRGNHRLDHKSHICRSPTRRPPMRYSLPQTSALRSQPIMSPRPARARLMSKTPSFPSTLSSPCGNAWGESGDSINDSRLTRVRFRP